MRRLARGWDAGAPRNLLRQRTRTDLRHFRRRETQRLVITLQRVPGVARDRQQHIAERRLVQVARVPLAQLFVAAHFERDEIVEYERDLQTDAMRVIDKIARHVAVGPAMMGAFGNDQPAGGKIVTIRRIKLERAAGRALRAKRRAVPARKPLQFIIGCPSRRALFSIPAHKHHVAAELDERAPEVSRDPLNAAVAREIGGMIDEVEYFSAHRICFAQSSARESMLRARRPRLQRDGRSAEISNSCALSGPGSGAVVTLTKPASRNSRDRLSGVNRFPR